jgi:OPA family sugar phosphate sensor protein UhpC-like MFS transporter
MALLKFFKTGADKPVLEDRDEVDRLYRSKRRSVFFALVFGYSFFYVCRLTLSIAKKPMIDEGLPIPHKWDRLVSPSSWPTRSGN